MKLTKRDQQAAWYSCDCTFRRNTVGLYEYLGFAKAFNKGRLYF